MQINSKNAPPVADAGPDKTVLRGEKVILNGYKSYDLNGYIQSYKWVQVDGPQVDLFDTNEQIAYFFAPSIEPDSISLKFELTVEDDGHRDQYSDTNIVIIHVISENAPPIANAGSDQTINEHTLVTLVGSGSRDTDDGIKSYHWQQIGDGPLVNLSNPTAIKPAFICPYVGADESSVFFELTITDNHGLQNIDIVIVEFLNLVDIDADWMTDNWEQQIIDTNPDDDIDSIQKVKPDDDFDHDNMSNLAEFQNGTDPVNPDSDSDGMPDGWEINNELNPLVDDAKEDPDNDGYTNVEEYKGGTNPHDFGDYPTNPYIVENDCHPFPGQGISGNCLRVPIDTSVVVRIKDDSGIDTNSVEMAVDGNMIVPVFKQVKEDNKDYWIVYHPSQDFNFSQTVHVAIQAANLSGISMDSYEYSFKVESRAGHEEAQTNSPAGTLDDSNPNQHVLTADPGTKIEGAKIIYDPSEPVKPRFGPIDELPPLTEVYAVGMPIALEPPTVFTNPVSIFIPCPGVDDLSTLIIYYYNPAIGWIPASQADGWMVPNSRVDHPDSVNPAIEIQVNHFSGVQAGKSTSSVTDEGNAGDGGGGSGGCYIKSVIP